MQPLLSQEEQLAVSSMLQGQAPALLLNQDVVDVDVNPPERAEEAAARVADVAASPLARSRKSGRKSAVKALRQNAARSGRPATGSAFWLDCMGKRRHTVNGLTDRALEKLGLKDDDRKVVQNRLSAWLYPALREGRLEPAGDIGGLKAYRVARAG